MRARDRVTHPGGLIVNPIVAVVRANIDRVAGWMLLAAGGISVVAGWVQVSAATGPGAQVSYLVSGGFTGLLLGLAGGSALLTGAPADRGRPPGGGAPAGGPRAAVALRGGAFARGPDPPGARAVVDRRRGSGRPGLGAGVERRVGRLG